jgi:hypothetical protein
VVSNHVREKIFPHLLPRVFISDLSWIAGWLTSRHIGRGDQDPVDPASAAVVGRRRTPRPITDVVSLVPLPRGRLQAPPHQLKRRRRRRRRRKRKRRSKSCPSRANEGGYCGPPRRLQFARKRDAPLQHRVGAGRTPPAPSRTTTRGGAAPPPPPDDGDSSLDDGECCPFSPMIDSVDEEEDRLCGASSWSLHTDRWSLRVEEGGGGAVTSPRRRRRKQRRGKGRR